MSFQKIKFTKMQATGNDFIMLDLFNTKTHFNFSNFALKYCDRHFGIGADGLIIVLPSKYYDFKMRIFNADGSEAEMCGNGMRCFAKFVFEEKLIKKSTIQVETLAGVITSELIFKNNKLLKIRVNMGVPKLQAVDIPFLGVKKNQKIINFPLIIKNQKLKITCVSMGNPHCVVFVKNLQNYPVKEIGRLVEKHKLFPHKTNVEFIEAIDKKNLKVRVWERGVGETLACGTGACASCVAAVLNNKTSSQVKLILPGGILFVQWHKTNSIFLEGNAENVFEGRII